MAFPEDVLTSDERVVLHLHPHWKAMIRPVLVLIVALAAVIASFVFLDPVVAYVVSAVAFIGFVWLSFAPFVVWRMTHYVFTNERVLIQSGVFSRDRRDIPLARVNDHAMNQTFIERILGCGTLTIESAGERGQSVLSDIPGVEKVQTTLYELVEADRDKHTLDDSDLKRVLQQGQGE